MRGCTKFSPDQRLAAGQPVLHWITGVTDLGAAHGRTTFRVERPGTLTGLAGWFVADLADGVRLTNEPGAPDQIDRRQAFLPVAAPLAVLPGDDIDVTLRARPVEVVLMWGLTVQRAGGVLAHGRYSTLTGMLLSRDALARTDPARRPRLTAWADARATILQLCDGRHTLAEIEAATPPAIPICSAPLAKPPSLSPKWSRGTGVTIMTGEIGRYTFADVEVRAAVALPDCCPFRLMRPNSPMSSPCCGERGPRSRSSGSIGGVHPSRRGRDLATPHRATSSRSRRLRRSGCRGTGR